jgi:structure-specific recognition protein 1
MYDNFLKLHGRTHDYKIMYKDISKAFLLPKTDGVHMAYVIQLTTPLRLGNTAHYYLVLQFRRDMEDKVKINATPE